MPAYSDLAERVAAHTEAAAVALWGRHEDGSLSLPEFITAATILVEAAREKAGALAAVALAARLSELTGNVVDPVAVGVSAAEVRTAVAVAAADAAPTQAIGVVVRDQTFSAGREVFAEGLKVQRVPGWRRAVNATACKVCRDLAGSTFIPMSVPIWHHKGCGCHQDPVL
jgi:hypothetical protein